MKIAYFDCFSGASGDMILGALLDAGLRLERLKGELAKLQLSHYDLEVRQVLKKGIGGSQAMVLIEEDRHHHRHLNRGQGDIQGPGLQYFLNEIIIDLWVHVIDVGRISDIIIRETTA